MNTFWKFMDYLSYYNNYPFYNMPISNGCFFTQIFPLLMIVIFGEKMLLMALFWMVGLITSVILDKYFNGN